MSVPFHPVPVSRGSLGFALAALSLAALVAGCSSSRMPAPIVSRTTPGATQSTPNGAPVIGAATSGSGGAPIVSGTTPGGTPVAPGALGASAGAGATDAPIAQSAPIRGPGSVEVRPLDARPPDTVSAAPAPPGAPLAGQGATIRTMPRLVKRPYSDVAMAEMQASAASTAVTPVPSGASLTPAPAAGAGPAASAGAAAAGTVAAATPSAPPSASAASAPAGSGTFSWPARGKVTRTFAESKMGILIDGTPGDPVLAAADGKVIFSGPGPGDYGKLIIIRHDDGTVSVYGRNQALTAKEGQSVKRGQKIAELGSEGSRPGLQFEIRREGQPVDPLPYLSKR